MENVLLYVFCKTLLYLWLAFFLTFSLEYLIIVYEVPKGTEGKNLTLPGLFCTGFVSAGASPLPVWMLLAVGLSGTEGKRSWGLGTGRQEEKQHQHHYFPVLGVPCLQTCTEVGVRMQQGWEHAPMLWSAAGGYRNRCVHPPTPRFHLQVAPVLEVGA